MENAMISRKSNTHVYKCIMIKACTQTFMTEEAKQILVTRIWQ